MKLNQLKVVLMVCVVVGIHAGSGGAEASGVHLIPSCNDQYSVKVQNCCLGSGGKVDEEGRCLRGSIPRDRQDGERECIARAKRALIECRGNGRTWYEPSDDLPIVVPHDGAIQMKSGENEIEIYDAE
ncbi:MAG: hypothetical protein AB7P04_14655 [Bacteriovoracia bacterium]